jgi:hypothetical protein
MMGGEDMASSEQADGGTGTVQGKGATFDQALRNAQRAAGGEAIGPRVRVVDIIVEPGDFVEPPVVVTVEVLR